MSERSLWWKNSVRDRAEKRNPRKTLENHSLSASPSGSAAQDTHNAVLGPSPLSSQPPGGSLNPRRAATGFGIGFLLFTDAELNGLQACGICIMGAN